MWEGQNGYTVCININIVILFSSAWSCFSHSFSYIHHPFRPCLILCRGWLESCRQRHFGIFFEFLSLQLKERLLFFFLVKARFLCFRQNTIFPAIIRNLKLFQCIFRTPSINSWRSVHRGEADYRAELRSAFEKEGSSLDLIFFLWQQVVQKKKGCQGLNIPDALTCAAICIFYTLSVSLQSKEVSIYNMIFGLTWYCLYKLKGKLINFLQFFFLLQL